MKDESRKRKKRKPSKRKPSKPFTMADERQAWVRVSASLRGQLAKLRGAPLAVYLCLALFKGKSGKIFPSVATIGEVTGYHRSAVLEALFKLQDFGFVKAKRGEARRGGAVVYRPTNEYEVAHFFTGKLKSKSGALDLDSKT